MGLKLVIADDAPFIREAIKGIVIKAGIDVVGEAADGEEIVKLAKSLRPDVILMDLVMPKKNGVEATKEILALFPEQKIVACSTLDNKKYMLDALNAGCCAYVSKPFDGPELLKVLKKAGGN